MTVLDPYKILNLKKRCTVAEARSAFRQLSKTSHPDVGGTIEAFSQIAWAHEILTDSARREGWDKNGWDCGPEKDRVAMAVTILQSHIRQLLTNDQGEPTREDLVRTLTNHLDKEIAEGRKLIAKIDRAEKRVAQLQKRFQRTGGGNSIIHFILESELRELTNARRANQQQEAARVELKRMISEYTFTWDQIRQVAAPTNMYYGPATTGAMGGYR